MESLEGESKSGKSEEPLDLSQPPLKIDKSVLHQEEDVDNEPMVYSPQNTRNIARRKNQDLKIENKKLQQKIAHF